MAGLLQKHSASDTVVSWAVNQISKNKNKWKTKLQNGKMTRIFGLGINSENGTCHSMCLLISKNFLIFPFAQGSCFTSFEKDAFSVCQS